MHAWRVGLLGVSILLAGIFVSRADDSDYMFISSPDFRPGEAMPRECALAGGNQSPQLLIAHIPHARKSLVLIVDDPDAPAGLWTHWLMWNIPPDVSLIGRGKVPQGAVQGKNSFGHVRYDGPAPPSGTHRYMFHLYFLDTKLALEAGATRGQLEAAMKGHVFGRADFFGTYSANP